MNEAEIGAIQIIVLDGSYFETRCTRYLNMLHPTDCWA